VIRHTNNFTIFDIPNRIVFGFNGARISMTVLRCLDFMSRLCVIILPILIAGMRRSRNVNLPHDRFLVIVIIDDHPEGEEGRLNIAEGVVTTDDVSGSLVPFEDAVARVMLGMLHVAELLPVHAEIQMRHADGDGFRVAGFFSFECLRRLIVVAVVVVGCGGRAQGLACD